MKIEILVDFDSFWASAARDIGASKDCVFVQTFSLEGDRVGKALGGALNNCRASDRRILVDSFSKIVLSDRFLYAPANWFKAELRHEARETKLLHTSLASAGVGIKYTNPFGFSPRKCLRRNHKKLIVIDQRIVYIGGMNFSEHNASWHDMMLRIEDDEVTEFFRADFLACWSGQSQGAAMSIDGLELHLLNGRSNRSAFERVLELIGGAETSIFVESPYITFPFYDHLRDARRRGVQVTVVTPKANNWRYFADYTRWESARCGIDLRLFRKGMSHLKAMLIDDHYLIAGSSNFDFLSYRVYEEIVATITEPKVIADFREQVMEVDLRNSARADEQAAAGASGWSRLRLKLLNKGLGMLLE